MCADDPDCDYEYGPPDPPARDFVGRWAGLMSPGSKTHLVTGGCYIGVNGTLLETSCGRTTYPVSVLDADPPEERKCKKCLRSQS